MDENAVLLKPGTPVCYYDYMERKHPALVWARIASDMYDLMVFQETHNASGKPVIEGVMVRSVGQVGIRGSRFELVV